MNLLSGRTQSWLAGSNWLSYHSPALRALQCCLQGLAPPEIEKAEDAPAQWNAGQVPVKAEQEQEEVVAVLAADDAPVEGADKAPAGRGSGEMAADHAEARTGLSSAAQHTKKVEVLAHKRLPQAAQPVPSHSGLDQLTS